MTLADTSIWIDHLRHSDVGLSRLLARKELGMHPFVIGEVAMGNIARRDDVLASMRVMKQFTPAYDEEVLDFVKEYRLFGSGIGFLDAHLLVSVKLAGDCTLWTRDKRLRRAAEQLQLAWPEPRPS